MSDAITDIYMKAIMIAANNVLPLGMTSAEYNEALIKRAIPIADALDLNSDVSKTIRYRGLADIRVMERASLSSDGTKILGSDREIGECLTFELAAVGTLFGDQVRKALEGITGADDYRVWVGAGDEDLPYMVVNVDDLIDEFAQKVIWVEKIEKQSSCSI